MSKRAVLMVLQVSSENVPNAPEVLGVISDIGEPSGSGAGELSWEARALIGGAPLQGRVVSHAEQAVLLQLVKSEGQPQTDVVFLAVLRIREASCLLTDERKRGGRWCGSGG